MPNINGDNTAIVYHHTWQEEKSDTPRRQQDDISLFLNGYATRRIPWSFGAIFIAITFVAMYLTLPALFTGISPVFLSVLHGLFIMGSIHLLVACYGILNNLIITFFQKNTAYYFPNTTRQHAIADTIHPMVTAISWGIAATCVPSILGSALAGGLILTMDLHGMIGFPFHFFVIALAVGLIILQIIAHIIASSLSEENTPQQKANIRNRVGYTLLPIWGLHIIGSYMALNVTGSSIMLTVSAALSNPVSILMGVVALGFITTMAYFCIQKRAGRHQVIFRLGEAQARRFPLLPSHQQPALLFQKIEGADAFQLKNNHTINHDLVRAKPIKEDPYMYEATLHPTDPIRRRLLVEWVGHQAYREMTLPRQLDVTIQFRMEAEEYKSEEIIVPLPQGL